MTEIGYNPAASLLIQSSTVDHPVARSVKNSGPLERHTTVELAVDRLRERILSGQLPAGTQLRQEKLASDLGVSRMPVREALRQLEAEGLVRLETHKGAVVARLSTQELRENYEIRARLERWLTELAVPNLTSAHLRAAERALEAMRTNVDDYRWGRLNWDFHAALLRAAGRPYALGLLHRIYRNVYRHFGVPIRLTDNRALLITEHEHILALCRAGDVARLGPFIERHILAGGELLISRLESLRRAG